jgi:hypothetical protein
MIMYKSTPTIIAALLLLLLSGCVSTQQNSANTNSKFAKLEMKLSFFDLEEQKLGNKKQIQVEAEIRNVGDATVWLPTKDLGPAIFTMGGVAIIHFAPEYYSATTNADGFHFPQAESELAIVELRPHEAIRLAHVFDKPGPARVLANYSISKEFAERYGTWSGKIDRGSIPVLASQ